MPLQAATFKLFGGTGRKHHRGLNHLNTRTAAAQLKRFRTVNLLIWLSATSPFFPAIPNIAKYFESGNQKGEIYCSLYIFFRCLIVSISN